MNETVSFPTNGCNIVTKTKKHCADVPTQIDCQERTVRSGEEFRIHVFPGDTNGADQQGRLRQREDGPLLSQGALVSDRSCLIEFLKVDLMR